MILLGGNLLTSLSPTLGWSPYTKDFLLLNELKQKFMAKWKCHDLGETTEFLGMHISHDYKNQKIFID